MEGGRPGGRKAGYHHLMSARADKTVYLHLGTYKTATTFLQEVLWHTFGDPGGDVYYPRSGAYGTAHHYLATDFFPGWTSGVSWAEYERAWDRLLAEIGASAAGAIIISSEMLCSLAPDQIGYIRDRLRDYSVRAILYLRRQDQYISSLAEQIVKGCNGQPEYYSDLDNAVRFICDSKQFGYESICNQWSDALGRGSLVVRPFEREQFHGGDILTDFFYHLLNRPVPAGVVLPEGNLNPRLCRDALAFKELVNRLPMDRETRNAVLPFLFAYSRESDAGTQSDFQEHLLLSPSRRMEILQRCADGNARIARTWLGREDGALFREAAPEEDEAWMPYPGIRRKTLEAMVILLSEKEPLLLDSLVRAACRADRTDRELRKLVAALMNHRFTGYVLDLLKDRVNIRRPVVSIVPIAWVTPGVSRLMGRLVMKAEKDPSPTGPAPDGGREIVPALFLHIRKTAGTSIVRQAMEHYGYGNVCHHGDYMGRAPGDLKKLPFISGHFGFDYARELMPGRFSFTFLRKPMERIVSLYYFCRTRDPEEFPIYKAAAAHDLEGFLRAAATDDLVRSYIQDSQVWCLAAGPGFGELADRRVAPERLFEKARMNMERLSFVGFTETFEEDARLIMRALKMGPVDQIRRDNVTGEKVAVDDLPAAAIGLLEELTRWDRKLYDAAWRRRQELLEGGDVMALNHG
jgi:hypothetical protein